MVGPRSGALIELPVRLRPGNREGFTLEEWKQMLYYIRTTWIDSAPSPQKEFARFAGSDPHLRDDQHRPCGHPKQRI